MGGAGIFLASTNEDTGDAVVWKLDIHGKLLVTVVFYNGSARRVANDSFKAEFVAEKEFFVKKLRPSRGGEPGASRVQHSGIDASVPVKASKAARGDTELSVLFLFPWVLPVIICALIVGAYQPTRRRQDAEP